MCSSISVRCFAKVNLSLRVLGTRPDGYHEVRTVMQSLSLHDTLQIEAGGQGIELRCDADGLPTDDRNLVVRAAEAFAERAGGPPGLRIELCKRIPIAAGLGGGSSDAAAALSALNMLAGKPLAARELSRVAAELGSDVPYFLTGGTAECRGRGEMVTALEDLPPAPVVVLVPPLRISAAAAYRHFDLTSGGRIGDITADWPPGEVHSPAAPWRNDLEGGVFAAHPEIRGLKEKLLASGATDAVMCGSGSAVAGRFADRGAAVRAAEILEAEGVGVIECSFLTRRQFRRRFVTGESTPTP